MINAEQDHELLHAQGDGHLSTHSAATATGAGAPRRKMGIGQKLVVLILLTVVMVPPLAGFYSYFTGVPLHLLASTKEKEDMSLRGVRPIQRHAGRGPGAHPGGPRRGRRRPGNPQGRARRDRGRPAADHDAAAGAPRLHVDHPRLARPHPRPIRPGPGDRDRQGLGPQPQDRA